VLANAEQLVAKIEGMRLSQAARFMEGGSSREAGVQ